MEKLCAFCEHMSFDDTRAWGSTWTGPYGDVGFNCAKGHFSDEKPDAMDEFRALILKAVTCPDYTPPKTEIK